MKNNKITAIGYGEGREFGSLTEEEIEAIAQHVLDYANHKFKREGMSLEERNSALANVVVGLNNDITELTGRE